ncbi:MAG: class I SAM-dependent methyltransferase [Elusimicrobiota bacterium]
MNYSEHKTPCQFLASYKYVKPYLAEKKVLDIGCATGEYLQTFSKDSIGIDLSSPNVDICRQKGLKVKETDINQPLPFQNAEFDVVFCSHVLEHVDSPVFLLREINRVLKKNGITIICLPTEISIARVLKDKYFEAHRGHLYSFTISNMRRLFEYCNFKYEKVIIDINWVRKLYLWWLLWLVQRLPLVCSIWWSNAFWVIGRKIDDTKKI